MTDNIDSYLDGIKAQFERIPRDVALAIGQEIFMQVVERTRIDSGQAALNWHFQPYEGSPDLMPQEMLWGYGDVEPVTPSGYKHSKVDNSESVFMYQFEYMMNQLTVAPDRITGVAIYNPISPGHAEFAPGSDEFYAQTAFDKLDIDGIVQSAINSVEASYNV